MGTFIGNKVVRLRDTSLFSDANLVSYWTFDGTANDQKGSNHFIYYSGVSFSSPSKFNTSVYLYDGMTNSYLQSVFSFSPSSFSVFFWVYPLSLDDWNLNVNSLHGWDAFVCHASADGGMYCGTNVATRFEPTTSPGLPAGTMELNKWQHFAYTFGSGTGSFYKNGILLATKSQDSPSSNWDGFHIVHGNGYFDDVALFNDVLTSSEVLQLATGCKNTELNNTNWKNSSNLVAYYRFEGNSNATIGGINGTDTNVTYGTSYGKFGQGVSFGNAAGYVTFGNNFNFTSEDFSFSFWVYLTDWVSEDSGQGSVLFYKGGWQVNGYYCQVNKNTGVVGLQINQSGALQGIDSYTSIIKNVWTHVCFTRQGSTGKVYINSKLDNTVTNIVNPATSSDTFYLGAYGGIFKVKGYIDDLAIFNRALTAREIKSIYRSKL